MSNKRINKKNQKMMALKRIQVLFELAYIKASKKEFDIADRYVNIARRLSMRYLVPIPSKYKRFFCKHCYCYILPDVNSRFRIKNGKIIIFCKNCKRFNRIIFKT